jgi:hypothetical protein
MRKTVVAVVLLSLGICVCPKLYSEDKDPCKEGEKLLQEIKDLQSTQPGLKSRQKLGVGTSVTLISVLLYRRMLNRELKDCDNIYFKVQYHFSTLGGGVGSIISLLVAANVKSKLEALDESLRVKILELRRLMNACDDQREAAAKQN